MFLYRGFTQKGDFRSFRFDSMIPVTGFNKATYVSFTLTAQMSLLAKCSIPVQDGPALCLHILASWQRENQYPAKPVLYAITPQDAQSFTDLRKQPREFKPLHRKLRHPKPSPTSQLLWPRVK